MNRKLLTILFLFSLLMGQSTLPVCAKNIIVQPNERLDKVRDKARKGYQILLRGGTYRLEETLVLAPENSGVTWKAYPGEIATISGGRPVTGWTRCNDGIWKVPLNRKEKLRQLYVNGIPARMAQLNKPITGQGKYGEHTITGKEPWAFNPGKAADGIRLQKNDLPTVKNPEELEIRSQSTWVTSRLCVRELIEEESHHILLLEQPLASILQNQSWGTAFNFNSHIKIFNALEFLDEPGEFYFDRKNQTLYYKPRSNENMNVAEITAPFLETLLSIQGKNLKERVSDINFEGIIFEHTAWQLTQVENSRGEGAVQGCANTVKYGNPNWHTSLYQTTDLPSAAVEINSAKHISFTNNIFRQTGSIGVNIENDCNDITVKGNLFFNIGACAVNIGHPHHVYIGKQNGKNEGDEPYNIDNKNDKWNEAVEGLCSQIHIENNLIRLTGIENPSNVVISAIFGHNINISHNDIRHAPYSGISMGWAWEEFDGANERSLNKPTSSLRNNTIHHNRIGNVLQTLKDGGGIYLLAAQVPIEKNSSKQKWTEINGNYLYDFGGDTRAGIHPDNGSRFVHFYENVFDNIPWSLIKVSSYARKGDYKIEQNYSNTPLYWSELNLPYSPNTTIKDNVQESDHQWSASAMKIITHSGLEPNYTHLFNLIPDIYK